MEDTNTDEFASGRELNFSQVMKLRRMAAKRAASPAVPSADDIAVMERDDVLEWLEAHGVEGAQGRVSELRKRLGEVMFLGAAE